MQDTTLIQSFRIQFRVIGALLMREILTRYGRHNVGFLWVFFEPMMFTLGVTALWNAAHLSHGSNLPITEFAVTGYSTVLVWRNCGSRCALAITPNKSLLFHRNVRVLDLFWARIVLEIAGATVSMVCISALFIFVGLMRMPEDVSLMIAAWIYMCVLGASIGLIVGSISERSEMIERLWHTFAYLLFPLSGAGFMVSWLPPKAQELILWLPMVHGTEMLRAGYFGSLVTAKYDVTYMIAADSIMLLLGLLLVRDTGNRVEGAE
ncbi:MULTISPECIES: ABC transporter permease [Burkholderia]|uniref:ABC transporter permease n=1 Tax=Burkholderia TaxID=32008 RepID=UPI000A950932|nr:MULTISPECIES: ABC transporter permease [Burkholderia]MDN7913050.1 ABC transporter permease [Burkholderia cepacia]